MKEDMIKKFYAVTDTSSLYEAIIGGEGNIPRLIKIDMKKSISKAPIGFEISNGTMLAICRRLILFIPEGGGMSTTERQISMVNTRYWGGNTSNIVALFMTEEEARSCLENYMTTNQEKCRNQWKASTINVLRTIGFEHPYCSIETNLPDLWLMPPSAWQKNGKNYDSHGLSVGFFFILIFSKSTPTLLYQGGS